MKFNKPITLRSAHHGLLSAVRGLSKNITLVPIVFCLFYKSFSFIFISFALAATCSLAFIQCAPAKAERVLTREVAAVAATFSLFARHSVFACLLFITFNKFALFQSIPRIFLDVYAIDYSTSPVRYFVHTCIVVIFHVSCNQNTAFTAFYLTACRNYGCTVVPCIGCTFVTCIGCTAVSCIGCTAVSCIGCTFVTCIGCTAVSCIGCTFVTDDFKIFVCFHCLINLICCS